MKYSKNALILCFASLITSTTLLNAAQAPAMPAPKADVYVVPQAQDLAISLKYPAEIKAYKKVQVVSRVLGTLEKQYFTEGNSVKQGDVLYNSPYAPNPKKALKLLLFVYEKRLPRALYGLFDQ